MSNTVSALDHLSYDGIAEVREMGLHGMITLRGDLSLAKVRTAATGVAGGKMPARGECTAVDKSGIAWMSPDELLVMCAYDAVAANLEKMQKSLAKTHSLAVNVSDARAVFEVSGLNARDVMAKLCPVDLATEAFMPGMFRRTRMAQVPGAFWMHSADRFRIICFRSHAQYVFDLLKIAAQPGSEVGYF
ncbi:MAG: sarcosine oxidase subunit gamma family protein [Paracoccaceae bacterium]